MHAGNVWSWVQPQHSTCALCQDAQAYAEDNSLLFMETSAKTAMNVNEVFMAIGEQHGPPGLLGPQCQGPGSPHV